MWDLGHSKTFPGKYSKKKKVLLCKYFIDLVYSLYLHCNLWAIVYIDEYLFKFSNFN